MKAKIRLHNKKGKALSPQKKIDMFNFPFTLNMNIGCFYACNYCYLRGFLFSRHTAFGEEMIVKTWIPEKLDIELDKFRKLPQHLKRIQINPATEGFHPKVINYMQKYYNRDIMRETMEVFHRHWDSGNRWMVHIVTKSNSITNYVDLLTEMRHFVQVEITIITADQKLSRQIEPFAPSINARLKAVEKLANAGIFVRIMASPFMTMSVGEEETHRDLLALKQLAFDSGAIAFKNKGLNYFDEKDVKCGQAKQVRTQVNKHFMDLIINSGEPILRKNGKPRKRTVLMPRKEFKAKWVTGDWRDRLVPTPEMVVDFGYSKLNDIKWGNIR